MEIMSAVVKFGTDAVLRYRTISGRPDNELPEVFLGGSIAPHLYDQFRCPIHIEYNFLTVAKNLGVDITEDVIRRIGDYRADIAMYRDELHPVIIELKVFDKNGQPLGVLADQRKVKKLSDICAVSGYVGVLICETENVLLEERIRKLKESLGRVVYTGEPQWSADGSWRWSFGCAAL